MEPTPDTALIRRPDLSPASHARLPEGSISANGDCRGVALERRERPLKRALWRSKALCAGMDVDLFFRPENETKAVAWCKRCDVRPECLAFIKEYESANSEVNGVFGGTTPAQRLRMRGKK